MDRKTFILSKKTELKDLANNIRETKYEHKELQKSGNNLGKCYKLFSIRHEYRHKHIVYSLLKGRTRNQIENKYRKENKPDETYLQRLLDQYKKEVQ